MCCRGLFTWKMPAAEHGNWVTEVSRECVFIHNPLILQGSRELITNLKTREFKWVIRSETRFPQEFNNGGWHGRVLSVFVVKGKCKNGKNVRNREVYPLLVCCFALWIIWSVLVLRPSTLNYTKLLTVLPVKKCHIPPPWWVLESLQLLQSRRAVAHFWNLKLCSRV